MSHVTPPQREMSGLENRLNRLLALLVKREEQSRQMLHTSKLINNEVSGRKYKSCCFFTYIAIKSEIIS